MRFELQSPARFRLARHILPAGLLSFLAIAAPGCGAAFGHPKYDPMPTPARIAQSQSPPVIVKVSDHRTSMDIPYQVAPTLTKAFDVELKNRGFVEEADGNVVLATLSFYLANHEPELFTASSGKTTASIGMQVDVKRPNGSTVFSRFIVGQSEPWEDAHPCTDDFDQLTYAVQAAMQQGVAQAFYDPAFLDALKT